MIDNFYLLMLKLKIISIQIYQILYFSIHSSEEKFDNLIVFPTLEFYVPNLG